MPDQLKAAIERRGFLIRLWLPEEDCVKMIVMMGDKSLPWEIATLVLATIKTGIDNLIEHDFRDLTNSMPFVWCKQCHTPLLRYTDQSLALKYLQNSTKPDAVLEVLDKAQAISIANRLNAGMSVSSKDVRFVPGVNGKEAIARASVYRSAKAGPVSPVIESCVTCQQRLDANSVEEIIDE